MATLPDSLFGEPSAAERTTAPKSNTSHPPNSDLNKVSIEKLILALHNAHTRERALQLLSQNRSRSDDLAVLIWHSFGTMFTLLKEIMEIYPSLSKPDLTERASIRVCNALALLQCVASHPETRVPFMKAKIPLYLYPFLNTTIKEKPHEYLRLTSLGVIGALVKVDDKEVIYFLLKTEIVPYCLRCMDVGKGLSKTKILMDEEGLRYCCLVADRFFAITSALETMMEKISEEPSQRLLKHIVRCYLKLSESPRACPGLAKLLPRMLNDSAFTDLLRDDPTVMSSFQQLLRNVHENRLRENEDEYGTPKTDDSLKLSVRLIFFHRLLLCYFFNSLLSTERRGISS
ncbi:CCR4-NOT transcription complex subunit 9-like isoform X2 [Cucurbita moschata]|uniref:CCR4-NOT transcription complex subunit 9-like isoform X2 n=1 Tax=Cucurbita moschata TaxID=3662 RepID=A0A6J1GKB5_CUCMO|nr:CCR4-NOT transcription complex subunit 9-like isoform X2 [Cucurbita moschata]